MKKTSQRQNLFRRYLGVYPARFWRLVATIAALYVFSFLLSLALGHRLWVRLGFLVWNLSLATLPLLFAMLYTARRQRNRLGVPGIAWAALWMLFYPNAPYLLTDLLHLRAYDFSNPNSLYQWSFSESPVVWAGLVHLVLPVLAGAAAGALSLHLMHHHARKRFGARGGWLFCLLASFLGGVGVWLGRCVRFNSWDLFHRPRTLLQQFLRNLNLNSLWIILLFFIMNLGVYLLFYASWHTDSAPSP